MPDTDPRAPGGRTALRETQTWFQKLVTSHGPLLADRGTVAERIAASSRIDACERVEIYRRMHLARLVEALADDYQVIRRYLGETVFEQLVIDYATAFPSRSYTLAHFGRHLPRFLSESWPGAEAAFLADLARVEAAMNRALDAPPAEPLPREALAGMSREDWPSVRLVPQPALELLQLQYPVGRHLAARDGAGDLPVPPAEGASLVVFQDGGYARWHEVDPPAAFDVLTGLVRGDTLTGAVDAAMDQMPPDRLAESLFGWFEEWLGLGLFCGIRPFAGGEDARVA